MYDWSKVRCSQVYSSFSFKSCNWISVTRFAVFIKFWQDPKRRRPRRNILVIYWRNILFSSSHTTHKHTHTHIHTYTHTHTHTHTHTLYIKSFHQDFLSFLSIKFLARELEITNDKQNLETLITKTLVQLLIKHFVKLHDLEEIIKSLTFGLL